jgi:hypothetical protein
VEAAAKVRATFDIDRSALKLSGLFEASAKLRAGDLKGLGIAE